MTLTNILKTTNMKHLLKALTQTYKTNPSPFYLLKMPVPSSTPLNPDFLFLKYKFVDLVEPSPMLPYISIQTNLLFGALIISKDSKKVESLT